MQYNFLYEAVDKLSLSFDEFECHHVVMNTYMLQLKSILSFYGLLNKVVK